MPTNADAIEAVRRIDASKRESSRQKKLSLTICIAVGALLWLPEPWLIVISVIAFLISIGFISNADRKRRELHTPTLQEFAGNLNWYRTVETVLRQVEGYQNRRRFYADPVLIPIEHIVDRVRKGSVDRWPEPPFGEVPRKKPTRRISSSAPNREGVKGAGGPNGLGTEARTAARQRAENTRIQVNVPGFGRAFAQSTGSCRNANGINPMPTNADAIEAVRRIDASKREFVRQKMLSLTICIAVGALLWLLEPWLIVISVIAFLISIVFISNADRKRRELHTPTLQEFAGNLNWYRTVETVLRHVEGYQNRRRFYADPVLIPIEDIVDRVRKGSVDRWPEPPSGEVQRKKPTRRIGSSAPNREGVKGAGGPNGLGTEARTAARQRAEEKRLEEERIAAERKRAEEKRIAEERVAAERKNAEEKRLVEERVAAERKRAEEKRLVEEHVAAERKRAEEERLEEERIAAERKRAEEERRRQLEDPRIHVHLKDRWSDALSIKEVWQLIIDGEITLESYGVETGSEEPKRLREFPELASLFFVLAVENERDAREFARRDRREKDECIKFHGTTCAICAFSFGTEFGEIGDGYIEAHHLKPVADDANAVIRIVNPVADLRPVCANCHRMLHMRNPPYSIEEMIGIRKSASKSR